MRVRTLVLVWRACSLFGGRAACAASRWSSRPCMRARATLGGALVRDTKRRGEHSAVLCARFRGRCRAHGVVNRGHVAMPAAQTARLTLLNSAVVDNSSRAHKWNANFVPP